jgi:hypothetical protein
MHTRNEDNPTLGCPHFALRRGEIADAAKAQKIICEKLLTGHERSDITRINSAL